MTSVAGSGAGRNFATANRAPGEAPRSVVAPSSASSLPGWFSALTKAPSAATRIMPDPKAALAGGFALAIIGALLLALIIRGAGLEPRAYALGVRPVSNLIDTPNWFSFIVALLAGIVGVVSLTEARSATLIGVFISVTTIPAASDTGVSLAFGNGSEAWARSSSSCSTSPSSPRSPPPGFPRSEPSGSAPPVARLVR